MRVLDRRGSNGEYVAKNHDVVFWYPLSLLQKPHKNDVERWLHDHAVQEIYRVHTLTTLRRVILPHMPAWKKQSTSAFDKGWMMLENTLGAYCQQIVNSDDHAVMKGLDPTRLSDVETLFRELIFADETDRGVALEALQTACSRMTPVPEDANGFRAFCEKSAVAWLTVGYVRELARRSGPFPRRQELDRRPECTITGSVPPGRKFVVSHCWEAEFHPSPSGRQLQLLMVELEALNAKDTDYVFYDYCSLHQASCEMRCPDYFEANGGSAHREFGTVWYTLSGREPFQERNFLNAMWEMGRLYSYCECEVVVLPEVAEPSTFPGGPSMWGRAHTVEYALRGWCVAEYSIARCSKRIANHATKNVQAIECCREWPSSVAQYARMMEETGSREILFTNEGDREVVKYNFFKMCFSLLGTAEADGRRLSFREETRKMRSAAPNQIV